MQEVLLGEGEEGGGGGEGARVEDDEEDCSVYIVQLTYATATAAQLQRRLEKLNTARHSGAPGGAAERASGASSKVTQSQWEVLTFGATNCRTDSLEEEN